MSRRRKAKIADLLALAQEIQEHREYERQAQEWTDAVKRPKAPVPVFSDCVIGYRSWNIDTLGRLRPIVMTHKPWQPGVNVATCEGTFGPLHLGEMKPLHPTPYQDCECGLYSVFSPGIILTTPYSELDRPVQVPVVGAVANWGTIQVHPTGIRSSHACIVALATHPDMPPAVVELIERVAADYGVPAVPVGMLALEASRHGQPLPDDVIPKMTTPTSGVMAILKANATTPVYLYPPFTRGPL